MTVESRLADLEAWRKQVEGWHIPGKLNKVGDELLAQRAEIARLTARVAALEAQLGDPQIRGEGQ